MHNTGAMLNEPLRGRVCMHDVPAIQQFTMASKQTKLTVLGQRSRPCLTSGSQSQDFISQDTGLGKSKTGQTSVPGDFPRTSSKMINQSASRSMQNFGGPFHVRNVLTTRIIFV